MMHVVIHNIFIIRISHTQKKFSGGLGGFVCLFLKSTTILEANAAGDGGEDGQLQPLKVKHCQTPCCFAQSLAQLCFSISNLQKIPYRKNQMAS